MQPPTPISQVIYMPDRGRLETFALRDVPTLLGAKLAVLRLFARYMQRRLREVRAGWGWGVCQAVGALGPEALWLGLSTGGGPVHSRLAGSPQPLPAALPGVRAGRTPAVQ